MQPEKIISSYRKKEVELPEIKVIGFDWDGTLVDSMAVKAESFADSAIQFYSQLNDNRGEIVSLYLQTRGNPRTYQFNLVQDRFGLPTLDEIEMKEWSDTFTSSYLAKTLPLFEDAAKTLEELKMRGYRLFLSSSVPQEDLDKTMEIYPGIKDYFEYVLGTGDEGKFRKGQPHLTYISEKLGIPVSEIAFVGDGADDVKGANEAGCFSIGKIDTRSPTAKDEIEKNDPKLTVKNLEELLDYFTG